MAKETNSAIPVDQANGYIDNYIQSYFSQGKFPIKSVSIDAASLRNYLNANLTIENVKIVLGQTDDTTTGKITMILVGYDQNGNYILNSDNTVLDNTMPCPDQCPNGVAGEDHIRA